MSYQEKRTVVGIISGVILMVVYGFYAIGRVQAGLLGMHDLKPWATLMLTFIGIGIAAAIVIQILFHILFAISIAVSEKIRDESCDDKEIEREIEAQIVEDEMDKLIEMKSSRIGFAISGFGFVAALVSLVLDSPAAVMLNILFGIFFLGSLFEGFAQLYFYRRGIHHG